jgi:hypothetical protein
MPSDWNRASINWGDLTGQPIDRIVYELWSATVERDYYYRVMSCQSSTEVVNQRNIYLEAVLSRSMASQIRYIYETFSRWLKPSSDFIGNHLADMIGQCVFIDDSDGQPAPDPDWVSGDGGDNTYTVLYGKGNLDYTSGGALSSLVGYDLSFIPLNSDFNRPNPKQLKVLYDILQLDLKNRCFFVRWTLSNFGRPSGFWAEPIKGNYIWATDIGRKTSSDAPDPADPALVKNEYNSQFYEYFNFSQKMATYDTLSTNDGSQGPPSYSIGSEVHVLSFGTNATYIPQVPINTIDLHAYQNIIEVTNPEVTFSYTPSAYSKIVTNNFLNVFVNDVFTPQTRLVFRPLLELDEIDVLSILRNEGPPYGRIDSSRIISNQIFANIAKEDFLKYYTEPTN